MISDVDGKIVELIPAGSNKIRFYVYPCDKNLYL